MKIEIYKYLIKKFQYDFSSFLTCLLVKHQTSSSGWPRMLAVVPSEFSTYTEAAFVTIYLFGYDRVELGFIHSEFLQTELCCCFYCNILYNTQQNQYIYYVLVLTFFETLESFVHYTYKPLQVSGRIKVLNLRKGKHAHDLYICTYLWWPRSVVLLICLTLFLFTIFDDQINHLLF